ncbi:MAG: hemin uptake protein HemP [Neomegalonema sp.]|nr:hemin uptake protein HemP [Neomegalonema sp.]
MMTVDQSKPNESLSKAPGAGEGPKKIDVKDLLGESGMIMIDHNDRRYLLRITKNNKLILTIDETTRREGS